MGTAEARVVDLPRQRVTRDYFERAYRRALAPALSSGEVDLVVHAGDLFHRPDAGAALAQRAFAPLIEIADAGVPVLVVPGNHERSRLPCELLLRHPSIFVFGAPGTYSAALRAGWRVVVAGFPYVRGVRDSFRNIVEATRWRRYRRAADLLLLCMHQCVEGATVGAHDYVFRGGDEVIAGRDIPGAFAAVLSGHIHRAQRLTHDLSGRPLGAPVLYAGATERTAFAERAETKGTLLLDFARGDGAAPREPGQRRGRAKLARATFVPLPSRPMAVVCLELGGGRAALPALVDELAARLGAIDPEAAVRVDVFGAGRVASWQLASRLRGVAPPTMSLRLRLAG